MSITHEKLLFLKNATVHLGLNELCPIHVNIGLGLDQGQFRWEWDLENEEWKMREYPPIEVSSDYSRRSWDWEIQAKFFESNKISPHWIDDYSLWGTVKMIMNNTVDYCPIPKTVNTVALNILADSSSVIKNDPYHWMTRKPDQLPLFWNLLYLFPLNLWLLTFVAILLGKASKKCVNNFTLGGRGRNSKFFTQKKLPNFVSETAAAAASVRIYRTPLPGYPYSLPKLFTGEGGIWRGCEIFHTFFLRTSLKFLSL